MLYSKRKLGKLLKVSVAPGEVRLLEYLVFVGLKGPVNTQQEPGVIDLYHWVLCLRKESRRIEELLRSCACEGPRSSSHSAAVSYCLFVLYCR